jgi:hypothetical protein
VLGFIGGGLASTVIEDSSICVALVVAVIAAIASTPHALELAKTVLFEAAYSEIATDQSQSVDTAAVP